MTDAEDLIKRRELQFSNLHPDLNQAHSVLMLLADAEGMLDIKLVDGLNLFITYDVRHLTLEAIESVLIRLGFHLDNCLINRMKRALFCYSEETQRANLGVCDNTDSTTQVFIKRYTSNYHGCRDKRPNHWRKYL